MFIEDYINVRLYKCKDYINVWIFTYSSTSKWNNLNTLIINILIQSVNYKC